MWRSVIEQRDVATEVGIRKLLLTYQEPLLMKVGLYNTAKYRHDSSAEVSLMVAGWGWGFVVVGEEHGVG